MSTGVQSPLDHPFLSPGNADNRTRVFRADSVGKLTNSQLIVNEITGHPQLRTHLIVVVVGDQTMLRVDQNPAELCRTAGRPMQDGLRNGGTGKTVQRRNVKQTDRGDIKMTVSEAWA